MLSVTRGESLDKSLNEEVIPDRLPNPRSGGREQTPVVLKLELRRS
jgi:hypothetical protein